MKSFSKRAILFFAEEGKNKKWDGHTQGGSER